MALSWTARDQKKALAALAVRIKKSKLEKKVDNGSLYAGSPMHYYCRICGLTSDVLPESHIGQPRRYCAACQELVDHGYDSATKRFME
jgi:hypothetical protein